MSFAAYKGTMPTSTAARRAATSVDRVLGALERELLAGRLRPAQRLDESELATRFKVSRTPVREALKVLATQGLVQLRPRAGAFVAQPTDRELIEMFETMAEMEASCAGFAARRATAEDRAKLDAANAACDKARIAGDAPAFYKANTAFHDAICRAAGNRFLAEQTLALRRRLEPWRRGVTWSPGMMQASVPEHAAILRAIADGDATAAAERARAHLDTLRRDALVLLRALG
jgi:DNA-binding GntR family transcriptional regulator